MDPSWVVSSRRRCGYSEGCIVLAPAGGEGWPLAADKPRNCLCSRSVRSWSFDCLSISGHPSETFAALHAPAHHSHIQIVPVKPKKPRICS